MTTPLPSGPSNEVRNRHDFVVDDTIDVHSLLQQLWHRRFLIIAITLVSALIGTGAVLVWPTTWRAEARLRPPVTAKVHILEAHPTDQSLSVEAIFRRFLVACQSDSYRRKFFESHGLIKYYFPALPDDPAARNELVEKAANRFSKALRVELPKEGQKAEFLSATLDFPDRVSSSNYLNAFIEMIRTEVRDNVILDVESKVKQRLLVVSAEKDAQAKIIEDIKIEHLAQLAAAIKTARLLNLRTGEFTTIRSNRETYPGDGVPPLYLRGYEHLEAEKRVLEEGHGLAPLDQVARDLELEQIILRRKLDRLSTAKDGFEVAAVDKRAVPPEKQLSPRGTIVIPAVTALGFGIALLFLYIWDFRRFNRYV